MRVLITGVSGFAGRYLARASADAGEQVIGVSRSRPELPAAVQWRELDLCDQVGVRALLREVEPEIVYHLAALSSVGRSWTDPTRTVKDNVGSAVDVLEAIRLDAPGARVVWVSSCEVYGPAARLPIEESAPIQPANPYAVSKAAGDMLAAVYADAHGLDLVRARPFNHAGPGQLDVFIVSALARQVAEARLAGATTVRIVTGNADTRRDFTDVRDVVRAYRLLAAAGEPTVYNVCSGHSISPIGQIEVLAELVAPLQIEHVVDPARIRAHEVMDLRGANDRIHDAVGWQPEITFRQTVLDTLRWWEDELSAAPERALGP